MNLDKIKKFSLEATPCLSLAVSVGSNNLTLSKIALEASWGSIVSLIQYSANKRKYNPLGLNLSEVGKELNYTITKN